MANQHSLGDEDWRTLQFSPFWAFQAVAGMDSGIDPAEQQALLAFLASGAPSSDGLAKDVFASVASDFNGLGAAWNADSRSAPDGLDQTAAIVARLPPTERRAFAAVLIGLATNVANASGGGGFLNRGPMGMMEKAAIAGMLQRFGVTAEEIKDLG
ncbi:MAG: hypothetical protein ABI725_03050 [Chloroflexota bacterium]